MNDEWNDHILKAAKYAEWASLHYKVAADYKESGDLERALYHALIGATDLDYASQHAKIANDHIYKSSKNGMLEILNNNGI
jgi:hypothetical protein